MKTLLFQHRLYHKVCDKCAVVEIVFSRNCKFASLWLLTNHTPSESGWSETFLSRVLKGGAINHMCWPQFGSEFSLEFQKKGTINHCAGPFAVGTSTGLMDEKFPVNKIATTSLFGGWHMTDEAWLTPPTPVILRWQRGQINRTEDVKRKFYLVWFVDSKRWRWWVDWKG